MKKLKIADLPKLLVSLAIPFLAGFFGGFATSASVQTWYTTINKPFFTPPNWLFAPVWTSLYVLMGISLFLIWREGINKKAVKEGIVIFAVQLFLNTLWSFAFFGAQSPFAGLIVIAVLYATIVWTILKFYTVSKPAAYLLIPYIVWVSIATALNLGVFLLNL